MTGAIITFLGVCVIVATYMRIVHSFLHAAEEPDDTAREDAFRRQHQPARHEKENSRRPQWAH